MLERGFKFGESVSSPWVAEDENDMRLWFEVFEEVVPDNVDNVVDNSKIVVKFEGDELVAEGEMYLFSTTGQLLLRAENRMNVVGLPAGIYVVRAAEGVVKVSIR